MKPRPHHPANRANHRNHAVHRRVWGGHARTAVAASTPLVTPNVSCVTPSTSFVTPSEVEVSGWERKVSYGRGQMSRLRFAPLDMTKRREAPLDMTKRREVPLDMTSGEDASFDKKRDTGRAPCLCLHKHVSRGETPAWLRKRSHGTRPVESTNHVNGVRGTPYRSTP